MCVGGAAGWVGVAHTFGACVSCVCMRAPISALSHLSYGLVGVWVCLLWLGAARGRRGTPLVCGGAAGWVGVTHTFGARLLCTGMRAPIRLFQHLPCALLCVRVSLVWLRAARGWRDLPVWCGGCCWPGVCGTHVRCTPFVYGHACTHQSTPPPSLWPSVCVWVSLVWLGAARGRWGIPFVCVFGRGGGCARRVTLTHRHTSAHLAF